MDDAGAAHATALVSPLAPTIDMWATFAGVVELP